jgi:DNA polymerase III delta subunit
VEEASRYVRKWLSESDITIDPRAAEHLVSLTGPDDLAMLRTETMKLASRFSGRTRISLSDVKQLVSQSREEETYRLTGAISERRLDDALESLNVMLEQGKPTVQILFSIAKCVRQLAMLKAAIIACSETENVKKASFQDFEAVILPKLKRYHEHKRDNKTYSLLQGHSYSLYKMTRMIHLFSMEHLVELMRRMSEFDLALKGGNNSPKEFLEYVIFEIIMVDKIGRTT